MAELVINKIEKLEVFSLVRFELLNGGKLIGKEMFKNGYMLGITKWNLILSPYN